jgi:hypothetical protein
VRGEVYWTIFPTMTDKITYQNIDLSSWIILYITRWYGQSTEHGCSLQTHTSTNLCSILRYCQIINNLVVTDYKTVGVGLNLSFARHVQRYLLFVFSRTANCSNASGWWRLSNNLYTCTNMRCFYLYIIIIYKNVTFLSCTANRTC